MRLGRVGPKPSLDLTFQQWMTINDGSIEAARRGTLASRKVTGLAAIGGHSKAHLTVGDPYADLQKEKANLLEATRMLGNTSGSFASTSALMHTLGPEARPAHSAFSLTTSEFGATFGKSVRSVPSPSQPSGQAAPHGLAARGEERLPPTGPRPAEAVPPLRLREFARPAAASPASSGSGTCIVSGARGHSPIGGPSLAAPGACSAPPRVARLDPAAPMVGGGQDELLRHCASGPPAVPKTAGSPLLAVDEHRLQRRSASAGCIGYGASGALTKVPPALALGQPARQLPSYVGCRRGTTLALG
uniref:Uncharacterized protein n=1 Tax=Zooxanthella nutricula TaxID=1333877 RepID=A0A6U6LZH9_9DINO|mmetsp:Transcript_34679/g.104729  ORF Transcript_34679/g.104729 Transcript_34679/m.104729 type:complete len:303 (+) Transcript_34679:76-984(+)